MVKEMEGDAFEEFSTSLFRLTRSLRSTSHLWVQLPGGLKRTDIATLTVLADHGDCRPGFIADRMHVGASVVSRQLAGLADDGLVIRRKDPADGRAELISLSPEGEARLQALRTAYVATLRDHFTDWDAARAREAAALLHDIADHVVRALAGTAPHHHTHPNSTDTHDNDSQDIHV
ncbi:MarR family winged helix-turn-helix transcriptional regulator [Knoellia subterranea]|nr:MarR family transcriptional regulator [Knoellia subterranea]